MSATWAGEPETRAGELETVFDAKRGVLRVLAVDVPRIQVLQSVADAAGIEFRLVGVHEEELITLELDDVPLKDALEKILDNQSYVMERPAENVVSVWLLTSSGQDQVTIRPSHNSADESMFMSDAKAAELADNLARGIVHDINLTIEDALIASYWATEEISVHSDTETVEQQRQREALLLELMQWEQELMEFLDGNPQLAEELQKDEQLLEQLLGGAPVLSGQGSEELQTEKGVGDSGADKLDVIELMERLEREGLIDLK